MKFKKGQYVELRATTKFHIGYKDRHGTQSVELQQDDIFEFDGQTIRLGDESIPCPRLRQAVAKGWAVSSEDYDTVYRPQPAKIKVSPSKAEERKELEKEKKAEAKRQQRARRQTQRRNQQEGMTVVEEASSSEGVLISSFQDEEGFDLPDTVSTPRPKPGRAGEGNNPHLYEHEKQALKSKQQQKIAAAKRERTAALKQTQNTSIAKAKIETIKSFFPSFEWDLSKSEKERAEAALEYKDQEALIKAILDFETSRVQKLIKKALQS